MLRIVSKIACFSLRLKGPASQRLALKTGEPIFEAKVQDRFAAYYKNTLEMYKNGFTAGELQNASELVKRVFTLNNATPSQIMKYRIAHAVKKYQKDFNDHGSAAIQCASMSEKIILLMMHVKKYHKDTKAARHLSELIDRRRNMLHYLMKKDYHRYQWICTDYGIPMIHMRNSLHNRDASIKANRNQISF